MTNVNQVCIDEDIVECLLCDEPFKNWPESDCRPFTVNSETVYLCENHYAKLCQELSHDVKSSDDLTKYLFSFIEESKRRIDEMSHDRFKQQFNSYLYNLGVISD